MTDKQLVDTVIANLKWCQSLLNEALGFNRQLFLRSKKRNADISLAFLMDMLDEMGYRLIIEEKPKVEKSRWLIEYSESDIDE